MKLRPIPFVGATLLCALAACSESARWAPPLGPPLRDEASDASPPFAEARRSFELHCDRCHPNGESGLGPSLNGAALPEWLVRLQIRRGFGPMPAFGTELDDVEIDRLAGYVLRMRAQPIPTRERFK